MHEFTRWHFCGINLLDSDLALFDKTRQINAKRLGTDVQSAQTFVEDIDCRCMTSLCGGESILARQHGFAATGWSDYQRAGPSFQAATEHHIEFRQPACDSF